VPTALAAKLPADALRLGCTVESVSQTREGVEVKYRTGGATKTVHARRVVVAVPPAVAAHRITFSPALPADKHRVMAATATWCGDWCKVAAIFKRPFWRERGASGAVMTPGPVSTWWEGGGEGEPTFALVGLGVGPSVAALARVENGDSAVEQLVLDALVPVWRSPPPSQNRLNTAFTHT
jgi:monoamine oxidase